MELGFRVDDRFDGGDMGEELRVLEEIGDGGWRELLGFKRVRVREFLKIVEE